MRTTQRQEFNQFFLQKTLYLFLALFCLSVALPAQNLFVFDQQTGQPVDKVFIYNDQKSVTCVTDEMGLTDISKFGRNDHLNFQHPSYEPARFSLTDLSVMKFRLPLTQKHVYLGEVVVSANKWESEIEEIPNKIEVIDKKEIDFNNPATSADMLSEGNQVYIQKSQLGGGSPMLRGFSANRILFVVDGIRMNNAIYRGGNLQNVLQADVNAVENAEVIYGPGTNIYGSDALGGVIDIHTLKPTFGKKENWTTSGSGVARISSADFEKTLHADINFANDRWAILASISFSDFDDLKTGTKHNDYATRPEYVQTVNGQDSIFKNDDENVQKFTGYNQLSFISKVKQQFTKDIDWTLSFYLTQTGDVPRYDRLLQYSGDELKYAEWYYRPQQWLMNSLRLNFNKQTQIYDHARFEFAYQNVKEGRNDRKYRDDWLRKRKEAVNIFSGNADFDKALRWNNFIFYGLELVYNDVDSQAESENITTGDTKATSTRYPDGGNQYVQAGAYFSYKKNFSKTPITLQAGARYSYSYLRSVFTDSSFYSLPYDEINLNNGALTASAGMVYHPGSWQLKFNLSSGFRAPNLDDVAKIFDSEPGNVVVPNQDLKPEYLYNGDLGVIYTVDKYFKIEISGFYSYLKDAMVRRDFTVNGQDSIIYDGELSQVQAIVNAGYATVYGATINLHWVVFEGLSFDQTLNLIRGKDDEGFSVRHAPPLYGATTLSYEFGNLRMAVSGRYNGEISYDRLAPSERSKAYLYAADENGNPYSPAWWTLNFNAGYSFNEVFYIYAGVDNILDYRYRSYSSGITAPGRNFMASIRYNF